MSQKVISDKSTELQSMKDIVKTFAKETTAHGIPRIIDRKKLCAKVFWSILVTTAFGMFSFQTSNLIEHFHTSHAKIELINSQTIPYPAVTFCNLNRLKRSLLGNNSRFEEILRVESGLDQPDIEVLGPADDVYESVEEQTTQSTVIPNRSKRSDEQYDWYFDSQADNGDDLFLSADLQYETVTPTWKELADLGHKAEDLILECKFNNRKCDHTDFSVSQSESYGNCFTFNGNANAVPKPTKAGSNFGLHLILFIEHDEYLGAMTDQAGIQIMTHQKNIMPHLDDVGFSLSPGFSFNMGIRQVEIKRLKAPYGNCTDGHANDTIYLSSNSYNYSVLSCQKKCFLDELRKNCSCVTDIYEDYLDSRLCGKPDRICRQRVEMRFYTNKIRCFCPPPCHEFIYNTQTTFSLWPDTKNYHILKTRLLKNKNLHVYNILRSTQLARENLVKVKIYFQELNYELVDQVPAYTFETVLGTMGGLLGLYIGFSLITVVETFIFLYDIVVLTCRKALLR